MMHRPNVFFPLSAIQRAPKSVNYGPAPTLILPTHKTAVQNNFYAVNHRTFIPKR